MTVPTYTRPPTDPAGRPATAAAPAMLQHAGPPLAALAATPTAIVLALLVVAIGAVGGRDVLILTGVLGGTAWITPLLTESFTVQRDSALLLPVAIAVVMIGIMFIITAVKPRRHTHRRLADDGLWMRARDVTTLITATARAVPGVDAAHSSGSPKRQRLRITPNVSAADDLSSLRNDVDAAVTAALRVLAEPPQIITTLRKAPRS